MRLLIVANSIDLDDLAHFDEHALVERFAQRCTKVSVLTQRLGRFKLPRNVAVYQLSQSQYAFFRWTHFMREAFSLSSEYGSVLVIQNDELTVAAGFVWKFLGKRIVHMTDALRDTRVARWADYFTHAITDRELTDQLPVPAPVAEIADENVEIKKPSFYEDVPTEGSELSPIKIKELTTLLAHPKYSLHTRDAV